jgi:UrcA family protein
MVRIALSSLASLILAAAVAQSGGAAAQTASSSSAEVAYRDLDTSTDKGAERLYLRLVHTARELCQSELSPADIDGPQRYRACTDEAVARAVADVHSAKLDEVYARRSGAAPVETAAAQ